MLELLRPQGNESFTPTSDIVTKFQIPQQLILYLGCRLLVRGKRADYSVVKGQRSSLTVNEERILIKGGEG